MQWGGFWLGIFTLWVLLAGAFDLPAHASTLGWTTVVKSVFDEIRMIGFICLGGGVTIAGIELFFRRHLDTLGNVMAAIGVGGGLVVAGSTFASSIGGASSAELLPCVHVVTLTEALGDMTGVTLYYGGTLVTFGMLWWAGRHHGE